MLGLKMLRCSPLSEVMTDICDIVQFQKISIPTLWKVLEIPRGRGGGGGLKVKILEAKYEAKLELGERGGGGGGGGGGKTQKKTMGGVWIFSGTARTLYIFISNGCLMLSWVAKSWKIKFKYNQSQ